MNFLWPTNDTTIYNNKNCALLKATCRRSGKLCCSCCNVCSETRRRLLLATVAGERRVQIELVVEAVRGDDGRDGEPLLRRAEVLVDAGVEQAGGGGGHLQLRRLGVGQMQAGCVQQVVHVLAVL